MPRRITTVTGAAGLVGSALGLMLLPLPRFGVLGPENAWLASLFLSIAAAIFSALGSQHASQHVALRSLGLSLCVFAGWFGVMLLGTLLRGSWCRPANDLAFTLLGPAVGAVAGGALGSLVALLQATSWVKAATAAAAVLLLALLGACSQVYFGPSIAFFDHFLGYYPGTFYDRGTTVGRAFLVYRGLTALWIGVAWCLAHAWPEWRHANKVPWRPALSAFAGLALAVLAEANGSTLGFRRTTHSLHEALGAVERAGQCRLVFPREWPASVRERWRDDCAFRLHQVQRDLGVRAHAPITVFVFRSADEKRELMGAHTTNLTKPWRREIFINPAPWPHPILRHELVHALGAEINTGPLAIPSTLGGWLPRMGLVEGLAVAIDWRAYDDLTPHQWTRTMQASGTLPPLRELLGWRFSFKPSRQAYWAVGSWLRYVKQHEGRAAIRRLYRGEAPRRVFGCSLEVIERRWHRFLRRIALAPSAESEARERLPRESLFNERCPHRNEELLRRLRLAWQQGRYQELVEQAGELESLRSHDALWMSRLVFALGNEPQDARARPLQQRLAQRFAGSAAARSRIEDALGDLAWRQRRIDSARTHYAKARSLAGSPALRRAVVVKQRLLAYAAAERSAGFRYFFGTENRPASALTRLYYANRLALATEDGTGRYLLGRQLWSDAAHGPALMELDRALQKELPSEEIRYEAARLALQCAVALSKWDKGAGYLDILHPSVRLGSPSLQSSHAVWAQDWRDRIAWGRSRRRHPR